MADIRINSLPSTATSFNADDYIAIDGASAGTRKMLAATLPLTDVTLGTSGPSVKSTLSARAPRQGLVFDGTEGATITGPVFGSSAFTAAFWVRLDSIATAQSLAGAGINSTASFYVQPTTGYVTVSNQNTGDVGSSSTGIAAGKMALVVYTRSGTTGTFYVNGIASGAFTDSTNYTGNWTHIGARYSGTQVVTGFVSALAYNRALSAAEVVALYEAGAPAAADYGAAGVPARNTSLVTGDDSTFSSDTGWWIKNAGATISGGVGNIASAGQYIGRAALMTYGKKYRVTFTKGGTGTIELSDLAVQGYGGNFTTAGTYTLELTYNRPTLGYFAFNWVSGVSTIDDVTIYPIGVVLAPDAAQAGGGSVWYDTSGNAANITLPASGVSWNVPTSGKINNALAITNTTASTSTSTGALVVSGGVGVAGAIYAGGTIRVVGSSHTLRFRQDSAIIDFNNTAENAYVAGTISGNTLELKGNNGTGLTIGTTGNATFAGTLTVSAGSLVVDHVGSSSPTLSLSANGSVQSRFFANGSNTFLESYTNTPLILRTNQTTALTITTGQQVQVNATTASTSTSTGALVVSGGVGVAKEVYVGKTCKVGTGSDNEGYTNVFTNKAENTAGPFDITLPSDCVGVVFLNSHQGGVGRSFREIPFICFGGTVTLGTSRTTVLTADPVTSVAAAASSKITISLYAANTNCYWGIYVNKS